MAAKFASLRTKPTLKLAFKGLLFSLLVLFVYDYPGSVLAALIFLAAAFILYTRPRFNSLKFSASFIALALAPFILPPLPFSNIITAIILGAVFVILVGVKNLILLRREKWYFVAHILLLTMYGAAILYAGPSFVIAGAAFVLFFLLFREFYSRMSTLQGPRLALSSALESLIATELIAILYVLPIGFIASSIIFTLILSVLSDIFIHHLNGHLSRRLILRNSTILIFAILLVSAFSGWSLI